MRGSGDDERFMAAALSLGRRGQGRAAPNPAVGALVVKDGIVIGRGATAPGGRPHAERLALAQAGRAARGATLYVTLEPCSHHGATPPCCDAVAAAGIARLVYAVEDANPLVAGRGAGYCRENGLQVVGGVCAEAARRDHRGHVLRMTVGRPMVTLKLAETADGYVAGGQHDARLAITGIAANGMVHALRASHDAIMVGINTVLADDPLMTVRLPGVEAKPLRVVLDSRMLLPLASRLVRTARDAPVLVLTAECDALVPHAGFENVEIAAVPCGPDGRLDLSAALGLLAGRGITRIFSEGGPTVAEALISAGLADEVMILTAIKPLGRPGVPTLAPAARAALGDQGRYRLLAERAVGSDRLRHYERIG